LPFAFANVPAAPLRTTAHRGRFALPQCTDHRRPRADHRDARTDHRRPRADHRDARIHRRTS